MHTLNTVFGPSLFICKSTIKIIDQHIKMKTGGMLHIMYIKHEIMSIRTYFPNIGDVRKTMNSNIPKTSPYSVAVAPLLSAWSIRKNNINIKKIHEYEYCNELKWQCS